MNGIGELLHRGNFPKVLPLKLFLDPCGLPISFKGREKANPVTRFRSSGRSNRLYTHFHPPAKHIHTTRVVTLSVGEQGIMSKII